MKKSPGEKRNWPIFYDGIAVAHLSERKCLKITLATIIEPKVAARRGFIMIKMETSITPWRRPIAAR